MSALGPLRRGARSRPVAAFLVASFALSWLYGLAFLRYVHPVVEYPLSQVASLPFAWGPLVAAAAVTRAAGDTPARDWLRGLLDSGVPLRWVAAAFLVPVVVQDVPDILLALQGEPVNYGIAPAHALVFGFTLVLGGALEEFGWRGFMQERLQSRWGGLTAAVAVGVAWAAWHLPLHAAGYTMADDSFLLFTAYLVGLAAVIAWVYNSTAGVVPAMVLHAAHNMPGFVAPAGGASSPILDYSLPIIAAVWLLLGAALAVYSGAGRLGERQSVVADSAD